MLEELTDEALLEEYRESGFTGYFPGGYIWNNWREQPGLKSYYLFLKQNRPEVYSEVLKPIRRRVMVVLNAVIKALLEKGVSVEEYKKVYITMIRDYTPGSAARLEKEVLPIYNELRAKGILPLKVK